MMKRRNLLKALAFIPVAGPAMAKAIEEPAVLERNPALPLKINKLPPFVSSDEIERDPFGYLARWYQEEFDKSVMDLYKASNNKA